MIGKSKFQENHWTHSNRETRVRNEWKVVVVKNCWQKSSRYDHSGCKE